VDILVATTPLPMPPLYTSVWYPLTAPVAVTGRAYNVSRDRLSRDENVGWCSATSLSPVTHSIGHGTSLSSRDSLSRDEMGSHVTDLSRDRRSREESVT
jgi:hypothetical protein